MIKSGKLFIVSGTTGAGKNTVVDNFLKTTDQEFEKIITFTTRGRRPEEEPDRDYRFVSQKKFIELKNQGFFLEWARVHDHLYATPKNDVLAALVAGKNVILIIDVQGALNVKKILPQAILIFITLENFQEIEKRFIKRHGQITAELQIRLKSAEKELKLAKKYNYQIINKKNQLAQTVGRFARIIKAETID